MAQPTMLTMGGSESLDSFLARLSEQRYASYVSTLKPVSHAQYGAQLDLVTDQLEALSRVPRTPGSFGRIMKMIDAISELRDSSLAADGV